MKVSGFFLIFFLHFTKNSHPALDNSKWVFQVSAIIKIQFFIDNIKLLSFLIKIELFFF